MSWLRAPAYLLRALADGVAPLRAEESLRLRTAVALGTGSVRPDAARRIEREWLDAARDDGTAVPDRDPMRSRRPADLDRFAAQFGISVERVKSG